MISYFTTVKDRLGHLKQTLPLTLQAMRSGDEIVIVDYGSTEDIGTYLQSLKDDRVRGYRYETKYWRVAHAKNLAEGQCLNEIRFSLDADNFITPETAALVEHSVGRKRMLANHSSENHQSSAGRLAFYWLDFQDLGGFDERMECWGYDTTDFVRRAASNKIELSFIDSPSFVEHPEEWRQATSYNSRFFVENIRNRTIRVNHGLFGQGNLKRIC